MFNRNFKSTSQSQETKTENTPGISDFGRIEREKFFFHDWQFFFRGVLMRPKRTYRYNYSLIIFTSNISNLGTKTLRQDPLNRSGTEGV